MKIVRLLTTMLVCFATAFLGNLATIPSIPTWYAALNKPLFTPPNWLFGPVWTLLYVLMAVAAWLVWEQGLARKEVRVALGFFLAQLAANSLWSFLFFGLNLPWAGYAGIIVLWVLILVTMLKFDKVSRTATWLMLPYIVWVSFASFLNLGVALLN